MMSLVGAAAAPRVRPEATTSIPDGHGASAAAPRVHPEATLSISDGHGAPTAETPDGHDAEGNYYRQLFEELEAHSRRRKRRILSITERARLYRQQHQEVYQQSYPLQNRT